MKGREGVHAGNVCLHVHVAWDRKIYILERRHVRYGSFRINNLERKISAFWPRNMFVFVFLRWFSLCPSRSKAHRETLQRFARF